MHFSSQAVFFLLAMLITQLICLTVHKAFIEAVIEIFQLENYAKYVAQRFANLAQGSGKDPGKPIREWNQGKVLGDWVSGSLDASKSIAAFGRNPRYAPLRVGTRELPAILRKPSASGLVRRPRS
jgi:hypothetical protein